ncbi:DsrE family protein [soil metagenome]
MRTRTAFFNQLAGAALALSLTTACVTTAFAADQRAQAERSDRVKVVYHLVDGNDQATRGLANIRNHLRADPDARIVVVALGDGIKFLLEGMKDRKDQRFDTAVAALIAQGVEFRLCENTLTAHNVSASSVLPGVRIVPSGVAEVARLQAKEGFAYLRP